MMKNSVDWQTCASKVFCFCALSAAIYLFFEYIFSTVFPFVFAFVIAAGVFKFSKKLSSVMHLPRAVCAVFIDTLLFVIVGFLLFYAFKHIASEISWLVFTLSDERELASTLQAILGDNIQSFVFELLYEITDGFGSFLFNIIRFGLTAMFEITIAVMAVYYMSIDFEKICVSFYNLAPKTLTAYISKIKDGVFFAMIGYFKAYLLLFVITFFETLAGLLIFKPKFAFMGALCVAAVDALPFFGAGLILIPWGIFMLFNGEFFSGVGLLALYIVITVVRRIAEPKIISGQIGIHPLCVFIGMYAGLRLFGAWGMLLFPVGLSIVIKAWKKQRLNEA